MANDEVLAAAERHKSDEWTKGQQGWALQRMSDLILLADAHAAHLAAERERERERGEPATLGVAHNDGVSRIEVRIAGVGRIAAYLIVVACDDQQSTVSNGIVYLRDVRTQGDIDDLLRGLGIETKREGGGG